MKNWRDTIEAAEIQTELDRLGFKPGDSFAILRFNDGRISAISDADNGADFARPWGPERFVV